MKPAPYAIMRELVTVQSTDNGAGTQEYPAGGLFARPPGNLVSIHGGNAAITWTLAVSGTTTGAVATVIPNTTGPIDRLTPSILSRWTSATPFVLTFWQIPINGDDNE